eukprot:7868427-Alexandrium_andersonii.AAC.1
MPKHSAITGSLQSLRGHVNVHSHLAVMLPTFVGTGLDERLRLGKIFRANVLHMSGCTWARGGL